MNPEVVILCQGTQQRLGMGRGHKQLLMLPACGVPILARTLAMVRAMMPHDSGKITVIGWPEMFAQMDRPHSGVSYVTLPDPGNSSLKGVARYLESRDVGQVDRTIVLLGDVVYSWDCLMATFEMAQWWGFVGTSNLSAGGGELWGVGWATEYDYPMMHDLREALLRHPPFREEYQPGQLRRWLVGSRHREMSIVDIVPMWRLTGHYWPIDDYTMDVDLPHHVALLDIAGALAALDDASRSSQP